MSNFAGNPYYDPNAPGWRANAVNDWSRDHRVNPETGLIDGPYPLPPWQIAMGIQAQIDRATYQRREGYMDQAQRHLADATRFQQGALGLLSSYRAGGSSALESGIYNQVAGGMRAQAAGGFERAGMTQPLDVMGDYRRHEGAIAARRADRANERAFIAALVGSGTTAYAAYAGGQGGQQTQATQRFGGGQGVQGGNSGGLGASTSSGGLASTLESESAEQSGQQAIASTLEGSPVAPGPTAAGGQGAGQQQQQQGSPFEGGVEAQTQPFGPQGGGAGAPQPGAPAPGGQPVAGGGPGAGVGAGPGVAAPVMGPPGVDRDFSPDSFAAAAAGDAFDSPFSGMLRTSLNHYMVDLYESDGFYQSLPSAINARWQDRLEGAVA